MKKILLLSLLIIPSHFVSAQAAIYGGYINVEHVGDWFGLSVRAGIHLYVEEVSTELDVLEIFWGDGSSSEINLVQDIEVIDGLYYLRYVANHTYSAAGSYNIFTTLCCTPLDINNIEPFAQPITLYTVYSFLNPQFQGTNSTALVLGILYDTGFSGQAFHYNINAFDPDGDSLRYDLSPALFESLNYTNPGEADMLSDEQLTIDPVTGSIYWEQPETPNRKYMLPLKIITYRSGIPIDTTRLFTTLKIIDMLNESEEVHPLEQLRLFPNPSIGTFHLVGIPFPASGLLYNQQGQLVKQWQFNQAKEVLSVEFPSGNYWLKVVNNNSVKILPITLKRS
ncbi:MAG: T9SS type A sorting domain-containing protein [Chitinophagales bacterium]|nr:T9SS type A sorting domain-containing protein [Chitinophagales bacterium]